MAKRTGMTWAAVCKVGLAFPGVELSTSYGTPALKVRGKFMLRLREDSESLAVKCGFDERDFRLKADPQTFFVTAPTSRIPRNCCWRCMSIGPLANDSS